MPLHARGKQQPAIAVVEPLNFPRDHALDRFRQIPRNVRHVAGDHPRALLLDDSPRVVQIPDEIGHEERAALGLGVNRRREIRREPVARKLERQVALDVARPEKTQLLLLEHAPPLQLAANPEKRMLREGHVGCAVAEHDHEPQIRQPAGQVVEDVDRRHICPVQVVDEEHQRAQPRDLLQQRAELALHALLRSDRRALAQLSERCRVGRIRGHLHVPRRCERLDQRIERGPVASVHEAVEHLEHRQERLGPCEAFGTPAAGNRRMLAAPWQFQQEVLDETRLADARLSADPDDQPASALDARVAAQELRALSLAPDGHTGRSSRGGHEVGKEAQAARRAQLALDLAGRRTPCGVLLEHLEQEVVQDTRNCRVQLRRPWGLFGNNGGDDA